MDENAAAAKSLGQSDATPQPNETAKPDRAADSDQQGSNANRAPQPEINLTGLNQAVADLAGQNVFMSQQVGQLFEAVRQLYDAVSAQCRQLLDSDEKLRTQVQKFQAGGSDRQFAGIFGKLFRDLIGHVNQLDVIVGDDAEPGDANDDAAAWRKSIAVTRDHFEAILREWGCTPIPIEIGQDEFDPEIHESVDPEEGDVPADCPENVIVKVRRRGWILDDKVIQYPQVVVG